MGALAGASRAGLLLVLLTAALGGALAAPAPGSESALPDASISAAGAAEALAEALAEGRTERRTERRADARPHPQDGPDVDLRLRIEADRISVTVRCNLAFADLFIEFPRETPDRLHEAEYEAFANALSELFTGALTVRADGAELVGAQAGFRHSPAVTPMLYLYPTYGARAMAQCRLELEYPLDEAPTRVAFAWSLFPPNFSLGDDPSGLPPIDVPGQLHDGYGDVPFLLTVTEPELVWHGELPDPEERFLPVPEPALPVPVQVSGLTLLGGLGVLGGLLLAGLRSKARLLGYLAALGFAALAWFGRAAWPVELPFERSPALPTEAEALAIFRPLHENIYAAFDAERQEQIYEALERSADGQQLDALYGQVYRSLVMEEEGGAIARVVGIEHTELEVETIGMLPAEPDRPEGLGFTLRARWNVDGRVTHFGHSHDRRTEYLARYTVRQSDIGWRIAGDEILEQRIVSAVSTDPTDPSAVSPDSLAPDSLGPARPVAPQLGEEL